jgi:alpha-methylacyl-CoA racemase
MPLNLKHRDGLDVFRRLVAQADVVVESYRPGVLRRLGCDYEALKAINPKIVMCSLSGYGQDGPYALESGHDLDYLAQSGFLGAMGDPQPPGGQVADVGGAYIGAAGIMAALFRRERTGEGAHIDTALFEAALPFSAYAWTEALSLGATAGAGGLTGGAACYNVYRTKDGKTVALGALEPKFWANFCAAVDRTDLIENYLAPDRQRYLREEVAEIFARRDAAEWDDLLHDAECCFSLVTPIGEIADDPHVRARGMLGVAGDVPFLRSPIRLNDAEVVRGNAPDQGAHTRTVLLAAGYSEAEIAALREAGAIS